MEILQQIKKLYLQLKSILNNENDKAAQNIIIQIEEGLRFIQEFEKSSNKEDDFSNLFKDLKRLYININQPHVGLSDYFIWKGDYEERVKVNEDLDAIKDRLRKIFAKY